MRIVMTTVLGLTVAGVAVSLSAPLIAGGQTGSTSTMGSHQMSMAPKNMMTKEQKVVNATTAAPARVRPASAARRVRRTAAASART